MKKTYAAPLLAAVLLVAPAVHAATSTDPVGDFIPTYTGPHGGDLDVVSSTVSYNAATDMFTFSGTMNAAMGTTPGSFYVWGVDRGAGVASFASLGTGYPNILFDTVVILRADGTGAAAGTALPAGTVQLNGDTISASFSGALLPTKGLAKADYTWNLWPRAGGVAGNAAISDFAPDGTNLAVTAVPEPSTFALLGLGLLFVSRRAVVRGRADRQDKS